MSSHLVAPTAIIASVLAEDGNSVANEALLGRCDPDRWYFSKERLEETPSRRSGIDADKELTYRQQASNYIQDIGQKLQVNQLCINTAIVYMHRFYMFHSFAQFHRNPISAASIFLAAKVEEQPRKLEHVIKVAHYCLNRENPVQMDVKSEKYLEQSAELVMNENILLQTLGFDVAIDHPHTHVVKCCQLVRASKDLAQTSYFMATNSLHLTTMCLQYKPTVVACVCIHLACKWSSWEIPRSKEGKDWFWYVDDTVTSELLEKLTTDFLLVFNKSPSRLRKKINSLNSAATSSGLSLTNAPYHGLDSSPGQNHNQARSRSPSPKRPSQQVSQKPSSSQPGPPTKPNKPHGMQMPHMKVPYPPAPGGSASKHSSSHPHQTHGHFSSHSSSKPHPGMPSSSSIKDPHHQHHSQQHSKNPYPPHGHGQHPSHGQYPHGNRSGMQSSSGGQSHHGLGVHSKPPLSGSSSSSSHPYSSSSSMKNMQSHNPSKPPHLPPGGSSKIPPNQVPGAVKNPSQPMFHPSSQSHLKKPYDARPDYVMKPNPSSAHHPQNHTRPHDKLGDGRHHSSSGSGLLPSHGASQGSGDSRSSSSHHNMYLGSEMERSSGNASSNSNKVPYMEEINRHRGAGGSGGGGSSMQQSDSKRGLPHGPSAATNGNNNDSVGSLGTGGGSASGASDSHVPSKNAFRHPPTSGNTFGQNSQSEMGANKMHGDNFGGEYGSSYSTNSNILSIEDRRKRRHDAGGLGNNTKRPRTEGYIAPGGSLFSPEESPTDSAKRMPPSSQFSPSAIEGNQPSFGKTAERSHHASMTNPFGSSTDDIMFGDVKPDSRRMNPSVEFQAPDLLQPISDVGIKLETGSVSGNAPRAASLFSPEFTPSNSIPAKLDISPPPSNTDILKRDLYSNVKQEPGEVNQQSSSGYSESGSQVSFTGRLSNSPPKREDVKDGEDSSHSSKKSKKKEKKHKHKHKEDKDKKHKKDKHKDKEKEKDKEKKDKHRSKDKEKQSGMSISTALPVEVTNDLSSTKLKIKIGSSGRDEGKSSHSSSSRHSSSKSNSSSASVALNHSAHAPAPLSSLKVKISSKNRVSSLDDDMKQDDESTPCCPGFGPCTTCNRETTQDQYRFFAASAPSQGLTMKIAKSKETSKSSSKNSSSSSSRESKKSKDKTSKGSSSASSTSFNNPLILSSSRPPSMSENHVHKNGMEKPSKKKEKNASIL